MTTRAIPQFGDTANKMIASSPKIAINIVSSMILNLQLMSNPHNINWRASLEQMVDVYG